VSRRRPHISVQQAKVTAGLPPRPTDATLSVTKAARILGVHPNTIRAWSDQGRLRYYRINPRGDRRYRVGDLQGFLAAAEATNASAFGAGRPQAAPRTRTGRPNLPLDRGPIARRANRSRPAGGATGSTPDR
jgi:excisionase family DNA binding protein